MKLIAVALGLVVCGGLAWADEPVPSVRDQMQAIARRCFGYSKPATEPESTCRRLQLAEQTCGRRSAPAFQVLGLARGYLRETGNEKDAVYYVGQSMPGYGSLARLALRMPPEMDGYGFQAVVFHDCMKAETDD